MAGDDRHVLRGRDNECDVLDRLLKDVHASESRVLVVRGEAGVGKSAVLDYVVEGASDCRVLRASGVEYEIELAYSGLHQLCGPTLDLRERLPQPQREALETAFGLSTKPPSDRFIVDLAILGLLSEAAEDGPLVCVVDDAQWLDKASSLTLAFIARRLLAESIGLVFGVRQHTGANELDGLPDLMLGGLGDSDARALLNSAWPGRLDEEVLTRVVAEARGNPLALLELPRAMTAAELGGGFGLYDRSPTPKPTPTQEGAGLFETPVSEPTASVPTQKPTPAIARTITGSPAIAILPTVGKGAQRTIST